jgi:hypothetical protein
MGSNAKSAIDAATLPPLVVGGGVGFGVAVGVGAGVAVGAAVGFGVGLGDVVGFGDGNGVALGAGVEAGRAGTVGAGVGLGDALPAPCPPPRAYPSEFELLGEAVTGWPPVPLGDDDAGGTAAAPP